MQYILFLHLMILFFIFIQIFYYDGRIDRLFHDHMNFFIMVVLLRYLLSLIESMFVNVMNIMIVMKYNTFVFYYIKGILYNF